MNRNEPALDIKKNGNDLPVKNVILITIDCLRADHLSCYGYSRNTTPFIDSLAEKGMLFTNFFANGPFTTAAFPAILSSSYPLDTGKHITLQGRTLIGELLQKEGINTAGIHSNPYLSSHFGYGRGFDYFEDFLTGGDQEGYTESFHVLRKGLEKGNAIIDFMTRRSPAFHDVKSLVKNFISPRKQPYTSAHPITQSAIRWISHVSGPFFLWVHYMDLHEPYILCNSGSTIYYSKSTRLTQSRILTLEKKYISHIKDAYDDKLRNIDDNLQFFFNQLKKNSLVNGTLFIITADHGQGFYEHGYFGHRAQYYDEILHIPLIIYHPSVGSEKSNELRSQLDISPTISYSLGIKSPETHEGVNLFSRNDADIIISESSHDEKGLYGLGDIPLHDSHSCRSITWKYIQQFGNEELYDLEKDPGETCNVASSNTDTLKKFRKIIDDHGNKQKKEKKKIIESIKTLKTIKKL